MFRIHPWFWIIVAHVVIIGVLSTVLVISKRHAQPEVPLTHARP